MNKLSLFRFFKTTIATVIAGLTLQACSPAVTAPPIEGTSTTTIVSSEEKDNSPIELTGIAPSKQIIGGTVLLKGKGLTSTAGVFIGDVEIVDYLIASSKLVIAILPDGVKSGDVAAYDLDGNKSVLTNAFTLVGSNTPTPTPTPSTAEEAIHKNWFGVLQLCSTSDVPSGQSHLDVNFVDLKNRTVINGSAVFTKSDKCAGTPARIESDGIETSLDSIDSYELIGMPANSTFFKIGFNGGKSFLGEVWRKTADPTYYDLAILQTSDRSWPKPEFSWADWKNYYNDTLKDTGLEDFEKSSPGSAPIGVKIFPGVSSVSPSASPSASSSSSASPSPSPSPSSSLTALVAEDPSFAFYAGDSNYQTAHAVFAYPVGGPSPVYTTPCGTNGSAFLQMNHSIQTAPNGVPYYPITYTINGDTSSISDGEICRFTVEDTGDHQRYSISFVFHTGVGPSPSPSPSSNWWDSFPAVTSSSSSSSSSSDPKSSTSSSSSSSSSSTFGEKDSVLTQLQIARADHTATLLRSGKVLLVGGLSSHGAALSSVELYDPDASYGGGSSTLLTDLPTAVSGHTTTLLDDGNVLIVSGTNVYKYNPNSGGSVTTLISTNSSHTHHSATLLSNGKVLIAGGLATNAVELYDPSGMGSVTAMTPLNQGGHFRTATLLPNGKILFAGGWYSGNTLNQVELYDPSGSGSTTNLTPMNIERVRHTATLMSNGKVLIIGGATNSSGETASIELYDPSGNAGAGSTQNYGNLNANRASHTATLLGNDQVLVVGGQGMGNLASVEIYDYTKQQATFLTSLNQARGNHRSVLLKDGSVLITAGGSADLNAGTTNVDRYSFSGSAEMIYASIQNQGTLHIGETKTFAVEGGSGNYSFWYNCVGIFSHSLGADGQIYITANSAGSCSSFIVQDNIRGLSVPFSIQVKSGGNLAYTLNTGSTSFTQAGDAVTFNFVLNKNPATGIFLRESEPCSSSYFSYNSATSTLTYLGGLAAQQFTCYFSDANDGSILLAVPMSSN